MMPFMLIAGFNGLSARAILLEGAVAGGLVSTSSWRDRAIGMRTAEDGVVDPPKFMERSA